MSTLVLAKSLNKQTLKFRVASSPFTVNVHARLQMHLSALRACKVHILFAKSNEPYRLGDRGRQINRDRKRSREREREGCAAATTTRKMRRSHKKKCNSRTARGPRQMREWRETRWSIERCFSRLCSWSERYLVTWILLFIADLFALCTFMHSTRLLFFISF